MERADGTTINGISMTLIGPELKVGDKAPDFECVDNRFKPVKLADTGNGVRIFSVVLSLDSPVCDMQTKRFDDEVAKLDGVEVYTVSADLPYAQRRWSMTFGVDRVKMLSDHKYASFGEAFGTLIKDLRVESRAIFVVDKDNTIRYVEYVPEVSQSPNYEAALEAAKKLARLAGT